MRLDEHTTIEDGGVFTITYQPAKTTSLLLAAFFVYLAVQGLTDPDLAQPRFVFFLINITIGIACLFFKKINVSFDSRTEQLTYEVRHMFLNISSLSRNKVRQIAYNEVKEISVVSKTDLMIWSKSDFDYVGDLFLVLHNTEKLPMISYHTFSNMDFYQSVDRLSQYPFNNGSKVATAWAKKQALSKAKQIQEMIDKPIVEKDLGFWKRFF